VVHARGRNAPRTVAVLTPEDRQCSVNPALVPKFVKEASTGAEFPEVVHCSGVCVSEGYGDASVLQRCLGAGHKFKGIIWPLGFNAYSVAVYVNPIACAKELGWRQRGGMDVKDGGAIAEALLDGAFTKSLRVVFTTNVGGWELVDDIKSALKTKMAFLGPDSSLHTWMESMATMRFQKGSELGLTWCLSGDLEATIQQPGEPERMLPIIRSDMPLCRNVFEAFLGSSSCTPSTRAAAVAGAGLLLDSENANRAWAKRSIVTEKLSFDDSRPSTWRPPDDDKDAKPQKQSPGPL